MCSSNSSLNGYTLSDVCGLFMDSKEISMLQLRILFKDLLFCHPGTKPDG